MSYPAHGELWNLTFGNNISDEVHIGFFTQDRAVQTEESDIITVKELTASVAKLTAECHDMRRDVNLTKLVLHSEFSRRLQDKALELYQRMNERLGELESQQQDRVDVVRRAFRAQMTEALIKVHEMYGEHYQNKIKAELDQQIRVNRQKETMNKELKTLVKQHEATIKKLKKKIEELTDELGQAQDVKFFQEDPSPPRVMDSPEPSPEPSSPTPPPPPPQPVAVVVEQPTSPRVPKREYDMKVEEIKQLQQTIKKLEQNVLDGQALSGDFSAMKGDLLLQIDKLGSQIEKLTNERNEMEQKWREAESKIVPEGVAEAAYNEKLRQRLQSAENRNRATLEDNLKKMKMDEGARYEKLMAEYKELSALYKREQRAGQAKEDLTKEIESLRRREQLLNSHVSKLKAELELAHKTWEKKFTILRQSLHSLKDESYIRLNLQRQASQLHQAAVMYAADVPMSVLENEVQQSNTFPRNASVSNTVPGEQRFTYTAKASHRKQNILSRDNTTELQDPNNDTEWFSVDALPMEMRPLPSPPASRRTGGGKILIRPAS